MNLIKRILTPGTILFILATVDFTLWIMGIGGEGDKYYKLAVFMMLASIAVIVIEGNKK